MSENVLNPSSTSADTRTRAGNLFNKMNNELAEIGRRLKTQDNRITAEPMFCVQEKRRDVGYDSTYSDNKCWYNHDQSECVFDEPEDLEGWEEFGYKDRWETVMVAFTEEGCKEYMRLNGHNHSGELRIYVESFCRCPEMIAIRAALMAIETATPAGSPAPQTESEQSASSASP
jgi:hypothetical protein